MRKLFLKQRMYCKTLTALLLLCFIHTTIYAQQDTTKPTAIDITLNNIFEAKTQKEYTLSTIKVTGNDYFDEALLLSIANVAVGDKIRIPGTDVFSKTIINLWKQNYFSDVQVYLTALQDTKLGIEIHVVERPRLSLITYKGLRKKEQEDLVGKMGLIKGRVVTESMKNSAIAVIKAYFDDKGYSNTTIRIEEQKDPTTQNAIQLSVNVAKGQKVRISDIHFFGNDAVSTLTLKKQLKDTKETSRFTLFPPADTSVYGPSNRITFKQYVHDLGFLSLIKTKNYLDPYFRFKLFSSSKFNATKFATDKENILRHYNALGYRDASIIADTQYYNAKGNMNIDIKVNEGRKYYFGNTVWKGNTKYADSILSIVLGIHKGDVYNVDILNKKLGKELSPEGGDIGGLYMDDGYLFFRAEAVETAVYNDTIDHEIRIVEGPQATIGNVRITGNDKTKEYVIRRELRTIPGEKFSRSNLIRSQRELASLNYFNQEKINPQVVPDIAKGTVDITWNLEEKSSDQLELSAGWGGGIGLTGTLGVTFNNFSINNIFKKSAWDPLPSGDGQRLSLRVQSNGQFYRSYNFSFTEPWLGGKKRNALTVSFYNTKFSNTSLLTGTSESYLTTTGVSLGLGKQLKWPDDYFSLSYSLNYTRYVLKDYAILRDPIKNTVLDNGKINNFNIKLVLNRSSIDQPTFPHSGSNFMLSAQFTPPYSLIGGGINYNSEANKYKFIEYHKWRFTGEWYVPIGKPTGADKSQQFVLKAAAKFGYIGRYNSKLEISPFERFQVGDAGLSNNFALLGYDIIAQRGYPVYEKSDPKINPEQQSASQFFTMFNKYVLELRYPFSTNPSSTIYGLAFVEAANGWYNFKEYNPFKLRRSVGVGMRFFLPMFGLLGFDYGIGIDRIGPNTNFSGAGRFTFMLGFEPE